MQFSENKPQGNGCYAVKFEGIVWASFRKEALTSYFHDVENIETASKYFEAQPVFDESNPVADPNDRRDLRAGDKHLKYLICDRSSLEFQLACAARSNDLAVVSSEICNILVDREEAKELLTVLREDSKAIADEKEWYAKNGERSHLIYEETCKAAGKELGKC